MGNKKAVHAAPLHTIAQEMAQGSAELVILGNSRNLIHVGCDQEPAPVGQFRILVRDAEEVDVMNLEGGVLHPAALAVIGKEGVDGMELVEVDILVKKK